MLHKVEFWIAVNVYALLLDAIALAAFVIAVLLFRTTLILCAAFALMGVLLLYGAIGIHGTYPEKCRIYSVLLRKNAQQFRIESFRDFVSVPCHRVIVRMVLSKLRKSFEYANIKKAYYRYPWQRQFQDDTVLHIFATKEEGDVWLLRQKNKNA